jgi:hypothetical protein
MQDDAHSETSTHDDQKRRLYQARIFDGRVAAGKAGTGSQMRLDEIQWTSHSSGFKSCIIGDYKIWKHSDGKTYDIYHKAGLEVWDKLGPATAQALLHKLSSQGWRRVADADQTQTAEEAKKIHIAKMGQPLGEVYSALWQAVTIIFVYWKDYVELFGTKRKRIDILNQAAPQFFRMLQDELWGMSLLHIARLTDPGGAHSIVRDTCRSVHQLDCFLRCRNLGEPIRVRGQRLAANGFVMPDRTIANSAAGPPRGRRSQVITF